MVNGFILVSAVETLFLPTLCTSSDDLLDPAQNRCNFCIDSRPACQGAACEWKWPFKNRRGQVNISNGAAYLHPKKLLLLTLSWFLFDKWEVLRYHLSKNRRLHSECSQHRSFLPSRNSHKLSLMDVRLILLLDWKVVKTIFTCKLHPWPRAL